MDVATGGRGSSHQAPARGRARSTKSVPWGMLGMLGLVLAVELSITRHEPELTTYPALNSRFAAREATRTARDCAVLGLGDSQIKFGFDPRVIERRLNVRAYNLAIAGSPPPASYFLLKRAIEAGARPSALVIGHMTLSGNLRRQQEALVGFVGFEEGLDLAWTLRDAGYFGQLMLTRSLPSLRTRGQVRTMLLASLRGSEGPAKPWSRSLTRTWAAELGAHIPPESTPFDGRMEPDLEATVYSRRWRVYSVYQKYFRRLLDLAAAHDIKVYWVTAPLAPDAQSHRDALGLDDHHTRNLRAILARHPDVVVIDARHAGYPASAFHDSCHLNGRGADRLSGEIAEILGRPRDARPIASRWIGTPAAAGARERLSRRPPRPATGLAR